MSKTRDAIVAPLIAAAIIAAAVAMVKLIWLAFDLWGPWAVAAWAFAFIFAMLTRAIFGWLRWRSKGDAP